MVFRAMVRDGARYDLWAWSQGARCSDRGKRVPLWDARNLACVYLLPEKVVAWVRRGEGSKRNYTDQFREVFGITLERAGRTGSASSSSSNVALAEVGKFPLTPCHIELVD